MASSSLREVPWWPRTDGSGDARCYAFQCADILDSWNESIGKARGVKPLFVSFVTPENTPALLIPLGLEENRGVRILRFLDHTVSDYNAPVVFPSALSWQAGDAAAIWTQIRGALPDFDVAVFEKIPATVDGVPNPLVGLATRLHPESAHCMTLPATREELAARLPNAADSRRRRRKLERQGRLRFEIATGDADRVKFLDAMMRFKRQKFIHTKGHDFFAESGHGEFYRAVTRRVAGEAMHISALLLDDEVLAAHWGYVFAGRFYHLMPAHAGGKWSTYAPGRLLNEWLMEWSIDKGLKIFDFCIGDEPYKFEYCDTHTPLHDAVLPVSLKGQLYAAMWRMKEGTRNTLRETALGEALKSARRRWRGAAADKPEE